jgi:hypothetical protein
MKPRVIVDAGEDHETLVAGVERMRLMEKDVLESCPMCQGTPIRNRYEYTGDEICMPS